MQLQQHRPANLCRVEYVLDAILGRSREESEITGDGSFAGAGEAWDEELHEMPFCENDNDYQLLLRRLCNGGHLPAGPYSRKKDTCAKATQVLSSAFIDDNVRAYA